jgi:hypothetical protein
VNGAAPQLLPEGFTSTGSWTVFGSTTLSLGGFTDGADNTITFLSAIGSQGAADLDFVQIM